MYFRNICKKKLNYFKITYRKLENIFPIVTELKQYNKNKFLSDVAGGVTIGIQLLPKGMAYAMMAGLDKGIGVVVAVMGCLFYPLSGSTPHLCVGPDPIICLLISSYFN